MTTTTSNQGSQRTKGNQHTKGNQRTEGSQYTEGTSATIAPRGFRGLGPRKQHDG
jgi:hypothetical protein